jgi:hypothetical protein
VKECILEPPRSQERTVEDHTGVRNIREEWGPFFLLLL